MSNIEVSPEDRERLAKSKFGEWFDEFFDKKFEEAFDRKTKVRRPASPESNASAEQGQQPQHPTQRRRSLLETCLTDTFGF
jgi:hypothetical protein